MDIHPVPSLGAIWQVIPAMEKLLTHLEIAKQEYSIVRPTQDYTMVNSQTSIVLDSQDLYESVPAPACEYPTGYPSTAVTISSTSCYQNVNNARRQVPLIDCSSPNSLLMLKRGQSDSQERTYAIRE
jgi:hypothetical protein